MPAVLHDGGAGHDCGLCTARARSSDGAGADAAEMEGRRLGSVAKRSSFDWARDLRQGLAADWAWLGAEIASGALGARLRLGLGFFPFLFIFLFYSFLLAFCSSHPVFLLSFFSFDFFSLLFFTPCLLFSFSLQFLLLAATTMGDDRDAA
jgi:hypothetical protein